MRLILSPIPAIRRWKKKQLLSEKEYRDMREKYEDDFKAGMGAEAIKELLAEIDLEKLSAELKDELETRYRPEKDPDCSNGWKWWKRSAYRAINPAWMILDVVPVIPPDIRPMVQLDGGRFATSDLNDLYRRVINRNNRLKTLAGTGRAGYHCSQRKTHAAGSGRRADR